MSFEESRTEVIDRLVNYITKKLPPEKAPLITDFVRQYYLSVSPEDLASRSLADLYGAVSSHWNYIYQRQIGEIKVRAFNPQLEKDGWQSIHTIIEISFDDMPFLVDSVIMALNRLNMNIHLVIHMGSMKLVRDKAGNVVKFYTQNTESTHWLNEAAIYIEIDRENEESELQCIENELKRILTDVRMVVEDWPKMRLHAASCIEALEKSSPLAGALEFNESIAFLHWLIEDHFTFLGFQEYKIVEDETRNERRYELLVDSTLGLLKHSSLVEQSCLSDDLRFVDNRSTFSENILSVGKTNIRSTVHRPAFTDFVSVTILNNLGVIIGEKRFIGLYTSVTYNSSPQQIPLLRKKVSNIVARAGFLPKSHDDRALLNILETLPRDDLFQASEKELLELSAGILHLQERQRIRLFVRADTFASFFSCLVFVPREKFTSALAEKMKEILFLGFNGIEIEFSTRFSDSSLARLHFVVRVDPKQEQIYDIKSIEQALVQVGFTWQDDLKNILIGTNGEIRAAHLLKQYERAFPASYRESFSARVAAIDIDYFETLSIDNSLAMSLYRPLEETEDVIRFKLFRIGATIPLSDVVPILENMGLRIISERPYEIKPKNSQQSIWINDYRMIHNNGKVLNTDALKEIFQEAFSQVWAGRAENDGLNHLVLYAGLTWREIMVLRAYGKYLWQAGFAFSQAHVADALTTNLDLSIQLIELFKIRFEPEHYQPIIEHLAQKQRIENLLGSVSNLNEDRILRRFMHTILATVRTNYYQQDEMGMPKAYLSFKLQSAKVPELPLPVPLYEIFVYSPRVEAIHLRAAKVARGGIRWSDRREDFRTEILSLMKTQQIKNAVIVPMGAKGGFVVKQMPAEGTAGIMNEVIECYQIFIRGLLDLTDNYQQNEIVTPVNVVRYDDNDPYLVVAADKGTATFSDIANRISTEYGYWLGDAFASGGETGYDHKKMGITARGAFESVKRHFQELNIDIHTESFTVTGIGDMAGDVFGNGMLLSKKIKLIAAFNHKHIFIDPNPDPEMSFLERQRLFNLPRSMWSDYDENLISRGGGVYLRSAKSIDLSSEAQKVLNFSQHKVIPNELIQAILKAPVDLFWNGGIGTYVKAAFETHASVSDRANDAVRVNGAELRCRVVGEGGNLGFTQLGRVEYAKQGGHLNTDAIDNSGGVNCSDNEVNIKILLNLSVEQGDLTLKHRNEILSHLQNEVAKLVLMNNQCQSKAISMAASKAIDNIEMHGRLIQEMERTGKLDRLLEGLPDKQEIAARKMAKMGLTRPEIAVLMAYSKISLKEALLASDIPEDAYFQIALEEYFPVPLQIRFKPYMSSHRLKREIIATQISNFVVHEMGINFITRMQDETGNTPGDIIRAYMVSRTIFKAQELYSAIDNLQTTVEVNIQHKMLHEVNRLVRRGTRWFLKNRREGMDIEETIQNLLPKIQEVHEALPAAISGFMENMESMAERLTEANVPSELAYRIECMNTLFSALDIIEAAALNKFPIQQVCALYFSIGNRLQLGWFSELIQKRVVINRWEALARATFRDDLNRQQRNLTINIMRHNGHTLNEPDRLIEKWLNKYKNMAARWEYFITELKNAPEADFTMFAVALRELLEMAHTGARAKVKQQK